jgi:hypothetical protein
MKDVIVDSLMSQPATLFRGVDMESLAIRRDTRYFDRLENAIRFAVDEMPREQRYGAYIRSETDHRLFKWEEIESLYATLGPSN